MTVAASPDREGVAALGTRSELVINTSIVVLTALAVITVARLLLEVGEILVVVLIAAILATGLSPVVERLARRTWTRRSRRLPRSAAIAVVYLGVLVALVLAGGLLITPIVAESRQFVEKAPEFYQGLREMLAGFQQRYAWLPDLTSLLDRLPHEAGRLTAYAGAATGVAFRVFGVVVSAITALILSIYMLLEGPAIKQGFLGLFAQQRRPRVEAVLGHVGGKFGGWLRGQLLLGLIIGVAAGLGTWAIGLPYPLLLGLAAGVTELIPMIGPVLGAVPAVLVALFGSTWQVVAVVIFFTVVQQIEGNVLVPRVMKKAVGLSPLLTIVAIMVGAKLMGILGALLAVPVAAALQVMAGEVIRTFRSPG
ncbi:MAG: AI-2E family transporter [bacterium]|nr:AI-2E family transporter [bacterium]